MAINPHIPLQVRPIELPDPAAQFGRALQLRQMVQQSRQQDQELEERQTLMQLYGEAGGDLERLEKLAAGKVSPDTMLRLRQAALEQRKILAEIDDKELSAHKARADAVSNVAEGILAAPPEQRARLYQAGRAKLIEGGFIQADQAPEEYPGDDWIRVHASAKNVLAAEMERRRTAAAEKQAAIAEERWKAERPGVEAASALKVAESKGEAPIQPKDKQLTGDMKEFREVFLPGYYAQKGIEKPTAKTELEAWFEYQKAKRGRQPVPGRDIPYPPDVEAQRKRMARAQVNGISPQQLSQVNSLAKKFDDHPLVKQFNETTNKFETVRQIVEAGLGGPGDLAVVFEFMKGLDPTSVVRESEYRSAAQSGNIFRGAMARFNGYFKPEGGFLPEEVKRGFLAALEKKLATTGRQVQGLYKDYARRIDKITGQPGTGAEYLTDYTAVMDVGDAEGGGEDLTKVSTDELFERLNHAK